MILEELASKLGFEVEGLQKLRAARKEWDKTVKSTAKGNKALIAVNRSAAVAATGTSRLGTALRAILGVFARLVTVAAGVTLGIAAVGTAFVIAGVRAARARREFVLTAKSIGTTGQSLETVGNILRVGGFGDGFEDEAKKVVAAVDEIAKAVRKGGDDAVEAKKKFQNFGIDKSFDVDPATGKSRDSAAIALDIFQAYQRATEQAAKLRREADAIANKSPRKAASLRKKAIAQDRKNAQFAEDGGISGKLKVLLDGMTAKDLATVADKAASLFPTTSNKSESRADDVATQAESASLKTASLIKGATDRLTELGEALAVKVLPGVNKFLDTLLRFGKASGLIAETKGERDTRLEQERENRRGEAFSTPRTQAQIDKAVELSQKRFDAGREAEAERARKRREQGRADAEQQFGSGGLLQYFKQLLSPEANAAKLQKTAEQKTYNQSDFGNDQRSITNNVTVNGAPQEGLASAVSGAVNQAVSRIKASNASTAGAGVP